MIERHRLKNVVIFCARKIIYTYNDITQKHGDVAAKDFCKYKKLMYKQNKLKLDIDFLNNCKQLGVYPEFLIFKLFERLKER